MPIPGPGRNTKWSQELQDKIVGFLKEGLPIEDACALSRLGESTYHEWIGRGNDGEAPFVAFAESCNEARSLARQEWLKLLRESATDPKGRNQKSITWFLEKSYRKNFGCGPDSPLENKGATATQAEPEKPDYTKYRKDPVAFASEVLGIELWSKQKEILNALVTHGKVLAKSANSIGKTVVACVAAIWFDACYRGICLVTSPKYDQIKDVTFKEIRRYYDRVPGNDPKHLAPKAPEVNHDHEHFIKGATASDPTAYQGHHADEMMIIFEEATAVDAKFWEAGSGMLAGGTHSFWLAILNPTDTSSAAYAEEQSGRWHVIDISALDHPNIIAELKGEAPPYPSAVRLKQLRDNLSQWATVVTDPAARQPIDFMFDGVLYRPKPEAEARILGRYPSQAAASIFSGNAFDLAKVRDLTPDEEEPVEIGCDVARFGDDLTSIHVRKGNVSLEHVTYHGQDTAWTASKLKALADKWAAHYSTEDNKIDPRTIACKIDDAGVGGGVVDQADGYDFVPVNSGSAALDDDYPNVRSELLFTLSEKLEEISLAQLDHDTVVELKRQAAGISYKLDAKGRRVADAKADIKKRIKRSPDDIDSFSLAYYCPMNKIEFF